MVDYKEIGVTGLKQYSGFIEEAYHADLRWPTVQPLYSRLRRSDPEIAAIRQVFTALTRSVSIDWELPDEPNDADKKAQEFAQSVTDDIDGGPGGFLESLIGQVPFFGWGWWEVVPGMRDPKWTPPGEDDWRSECDDKKIGIRRLAWRDSSSFFGWDISNTGKLRGMIQYAFPNPAVTLPLDRSLHIVFGDAHNPEGLSPLEAVWRLERIKYGLEVIQGIGFEHAAGYLDIHSTNALTEDDKRLIKQVARSLMSAQEGNYIALPSHLTAEIKDINFSAAGSLLEAIRYYGLLKLQVYLSQWVAIASTAGTGAYSAASDASSMFMQVFNGMMKGFAKQMDAQIGRRLFTWNNFPGMTRRPRLIITPIEKTISLGELASLLGPIKNVMPLGDDDFIAIRRRTGFLPETLPEIDERPPEPQPGTTPPQDGNQDEPPADEQPQDEPQDGEDKPADEQTAQKSEQMAQQQQYWRRYLLAHPEAMNGQ